MPAAGEDREARLRREIEFHRRIASRAEEIWNWDSPAGRRRADRRAELFVEHCSGCHTMNAAGTQGSATDVRTREYKDGPNFDQRHETVNCVLYAIRNGGFSGGPMPQNIVTGDEALAVAKYVAENSKQLEKSATAVEVPDCPPAD